MGVGWITQIWSNADRSDVAIQSVDGMNNGRIWPAGSDKSRQSVDLANGDWNSLSPHTHYFEENRRTRWGCPRG
jgi:hypothetical protein